MVKSSLTWAQKPANFSSGTRFEVAQALVNTIAAVNCSSSSNNSSRKRLSEMIFLDPFCGSGTLCVAAKQLGFGNVIGSDAKEHLIEKSRRNARWFFSAASGAQAVPLEASSSSPFPQFQQANAFIQPRLHTTQVKQSSFQTCRLVVTSILSHLHTRRNHLQQRHIYS